MIQRVKEPNEATFVGNRKLSALNLVGPDNKTLREKYIVGEPQDCAVGSADRMKQMGYVGIYEKTLDTSISKKIGPLLRRRWIE